MKAENIDLPQFLGEEDARRHEVAMMTAFRLASQSILFGSHQLRAADKPVYRVANVVPPDKTYPYFRSELVGPGIEHGVIFIHEFESCGPSTIRMLNIAYEQGRQAAMQEPK